MALRWDKDNPVCETNNVFYSSQHANLKPCCPVVPGLCAGGVACPVNGVCPGTGVTCQPGPAVDRPNFILMISDDQGSCHYGSAGECRSSLTGTPIPAPVTPNLDLLAGYGTVFPIAHNTASWCFPSLASVLTGRFQKSFRGLAHPAEYLGSLPRTLRTLDDEPTAPVDPYNAKNRIGGYCTVLGGKLTPGLGYHGFNARTRTGERTHGRTTCVSGGPGQPPACGSDIVAAYDPKAIRRMSDMFHFLDGLLYRVPGSNPVQYGIQNFLVWYTPRIPHQPLRSPQVIDDYLFGTASGYPLGGLMDLGALCTGGNCPSSVTAFNEANFGTVAEMYSNVWWMDDGIREIRKYLARVSEPHCVDALGLSRFDLTQANCAAVAGGTWVTTFDFDLPRETMIVFLSDNGWQLPRSKHAYTENGQRTRLIVFDPRPLATVPDWDPEGQAAPPANESPALAHAVDVYSTIVGAALGTPDGQQLCPVGLDGIRCDGRDLRAHLATAPGGPAPPENLRHALCGHHTQRVISPGMDRYLVTRPGSVGRCTLTSAPSCVSDATCGAGEFCLGGHCMPKTEPMCTSSATCPAGSLCLGGRCRVGPACVDDSDCTTALPGQSTACVQHATKWCRNSPSTSCTANADCPACPDGGACGRLCEARVLKFYAPFLYAAQASDLFLDPDEDGLHQGASAVGTVTGDMSLLTGPYATGIRRAACCLDQWWYEPAMGPSICTAGFSCPTDLTCNE